MGIKAVTVSMVTVLGLSLAGAAQAAPPTCQDRTASVRPSGARAVGVGCEVVSPPAVYTVLDPPQHGTLGAIVQNSGAVTYRATAGYTGDDRFTIRATNPDGEASQATTTIKVTDVDQPPICTAATARGFNGFPIAMVAPCYDPDEGDALQLYVVDQPQHGIVEGNGSPQLQYRSTTGTITSPDRVTVRAVSHGADAGPVEVTIVPDPAQDPDAELHCDQPPPLRGRHDATLTLPAMSCTGPSGYMGYPITIVDPPGHGIVTTGWFASGGTYTSDQDYVGSDSFTIKVIIGEHESELLTQHVEVTEDDQPPVCSGSAGYVFNVRHGRTISSVGQCSDVESDPLTLTLTDPQPAHGGATFDPSGGFGLTWTYTADQGYGGDDRFGYAADDGTKKSATVTQRVHVVGPAENNPPQCYGGQAVTAPADSGAGFFLNCSDLDSDEVTYTIVDRPQHGTVGDVSSPFPGFTILSYTPDPAYRGPDRVTYRATDSFGESTGAIELKITVTDPVPPFDPGGGGTPGPPACGPDIDASVRPGSYFQLYPYCTGMAVTQQPEHGSIIDLFSGSLMYRPDDGYTGPDTVVLHLENQAGSDDVTFNLDITPDANHLPDCYPQYDLVTRAQPVDVRLSCYDNDGDPLTYTVTKAPAHGTLGDPDPASGLATYTPADGYTGRDDFSYKANDGRGDSPVVNQKLTVRSATGNARPVCDSTNSTMWATANRPAYITANCHDGDNDPLTVTVTSPPEHGEFVHNDGSLPESWMYTAPSGFSGTDHFTLVADDGRSTSTPATYNIIVTSDVTPTEPTPDPQPTPPTCTTLAANVIRDQPRELKLICGSAFGTPGFTPAVSAAPTHGTVSAVATDGTVTYRPAPGYVGEDRFSYRAVKGELSGTDALVTLTIKEPDQVDGPVTPTPSDQPAATPVPTTAAAPALAKRTVPRSDLLAQATQQLGEPVTFAKGANLGVAAALVPKKATTASSGDPVLALACAKDACRVKVVQELRVGKRKVKLPTRRVSLAEGTTTAIAPIIKKGTRKRLGGAKKATLVLTVTVRDAAGRAYKATVKRRIRLR